MYLKLATVHSSVSDRCVCVCRPGVPGASLPARAVLSMGGLSHGVIRVNTEDKNSALTVQDVGHVMPGGENKHCRMTVLLLSTIKLLSVYLKGFTSESEYNLSIEKEYCYYYYFPKGFVVSTHNQIQTAAFVIQKHKFLSIKRD